MKTASEPTPIHVHKYQDAQGRKLAVVYACRLKWEQLERTEKLAAWNIQR